MSTLATILPLILASVILVAVVQVLVRIFADAAVEGAAKRTNSDASATNTKKEAQFCSVDEAQPSTPAPSATSGYTPLKEKSLEGATQPAR